MKRMTAGLFFLPALRKEMRSYLRGAMAGLILSLYSGLILLALILMYRSITSQVNMGAPLVSAQIGQALFTGLMLMVQTLTVFVAPALTINSISSEHERHTFEMMLVTMLSPLHILLGKLVSALAFLLLLLLTTLPLFSIVLLFGGVTLVDIGRALLTVLLSAVAGCVLGLFCSAITRQTYTATMLCYAIIVSLIGGTIFASNLWSMLYNMRAAPTEYVVANPLSAIAAALARTHPPEVLSPGTLSPLAILGLLTNGTIVQVGRERMVLPLYRATWLLYAGSALLLLWISMHAVQPYQQWRLQRSDAVLLVLLLLYLALVWLSRAWWLQGLGILPA